jgi:hypothetical protein
MEHAYTIGKCNKKQLREPHHGALLSIPHSERVLTDLMLFLCLALFFTGIMIAGAILVA